MQSSCCRRKSAIVIFRLADIISELNPDMTITRRFEPQKTCIISGSKPKRHINTLAPVRRQAIAVISPMSHIAAESGPIRYDPRDAMLVIHTAPNANTATGSPTAENDLRRVIPAHCLFIS